MYAAALKMHCEASENVSRNGAICSHPRTGTPIENPYLKVQSHAVTILSKFRKVNSDRVLRLLQQPPPSS
jgi:phage terminase small subunit